MSLRIVVIGVGNAGGNVLNYMSYTGVKGIEYVLANTDIHVLDNSSISKKLLLGPKLTKGLGAGLEPTISKDATLENSDEIREILERTDIVFLVAGLGGETGTGASPVIAKIAKEVAALTIAIVSKPFTFEGKQRNDIAEQGIKVLKDTCDSVVVIPNDKLLSIIDKRLGMHETFKIVDSVLAQAIIGMSSAMIPSGKNDINLDLADLKIIMQHRGIAFMGVGEDQGEDAVKEAVNAAIESPLLDNMSIYGAQGVLVHFQIHPDYPTVDINEGMEIIHESVKSEADVIFGITTDANMPINAVRVTLIATGFERDLNESVNNVDYIP